ncbi:GNAT family N-acetyltransferase [Mangrovicoccus algicola]|uniref:GNAT family N-acetyltransferase n=1 Tax=Mangrovicoccus algicola TaxID=2771008 RepID=A0A8J6Z682_9RHOB|nr:GNAT family N-acetyltransferase [Mangrovicoccus algicola]MBE3637160.1 GNAT family N-acetyltransferase [Mangrovicoccus algicola]
MEQTTLAPLPAIGATRFDLRPIRISDAGLWALYAGDARVAQMTPAIPHPLPPGAAEAYVARATAPDRGDETWVLDGSRTGLSEFLGVVTLTRIDTGKAEISYWVGPAFWNAGYASEAVEALLGSNPLGLDTVYASVFQGNPQSARVLTHAGFEYIGDAEAYCLAQNRMLPTWTYLRRLAAAA